MISYICKIKKEITIVPLGGPEDTLVFEIKEERAARSGAAKNDYYSNSI